MENRKINILGTEYRIEFRKEDEDTILKDCNGYCDVTVKLIVVLAEPNKECDYEDFSFIQKKTLRHEIVHAFLTESGLFNNTYNVDDGWAKNEEMVDWFAIQSPKIFDVYAELGLIDISILKLSSIPKLEIGIVSNLQGATESLNNISDSIKRISKASRQVGIE